MSRNHLKHSQSLHFLSVLKWVLIAGVLCGLGLGYMLCKNQNLHLAEETRQLQAQLDGINQHNRQLIDDLDVMKSPKQLQRRLVDMHSTLINLWEMPAQVVRMDQNSTRARLARTGAAPPDEISDNPAAMSADAGGNSSR